MDALTLQDTILHWLQSPFFIDHRKELIDKFDPELFISEPHRKVWLSHVSAFEGKKLLDCDWKLSERCSNEFYGSQKFDIDEAIQLMRKYKAEDMITKSMHKIVSETNAGQKPTEEILKSLEEALIVSNDLIRPPEKTSVYELMDQVLEQRENSKILGIPTGIRDLDDDTKRLRAGHFWVIGGYTNVGKTGFMLKIVDHVCKQGKRVVIYSLEMTGVDLADRLLAYNEFIGNPKALDNVAYAKLDIVNSRMTLDSIIRHIRSQKEKPDVVFIDFLQNIQTDDESEYERMTKIALRLQATAISEQICIVGLSQISNESAKTKGFQTLGFKGSGAIGAACDVGIELSRDFEKEGTHELVEVTMVVRKNRHGKTFLSSYPFNRSKGFIYFNQDNYGTKS